VDEAYLDDITLERWELTPPRCAPSPARGQAPFAVEAPPGSFDN
jgi:hypothetical protein